MKSLAVQAFSRRQTMHGSVAALASLALGGTARAQTKFSLGHRQHRSLLLLLLYVTLKKGYFKDQGIDVE